MEKWKTGLAKMKVWQTNKKTGEKKQVIVWRPIRDALVKKFSTVSKDKKDKIVVPIKRKGRYSILPFTFF